MTRRKAMEQFADHYRTEIEQLQRDIALMKAGSMGLWAVIDGKKVDQTPQTIERNESTAAYLQKLVDSVQARIEAGEFD